jgi:hypothetical protein
MPITYRTAKLRPGEGKFNDQNPKSKETSKFNPQVTTTSDGWFRPKANR